MASSIFIGYFGGARISYDGTSVTFAGPILLPDGSVSAPSLGFTNSTSTGLYSPGANELAATINGTALFDLFAQNVRLSSVTNLGWSSGDPTAAGSDTILSRGAANRLDLSTGDSFYIVSGGLGVGVAPSSASYITAGAGTTAIAPLTITNGTNLTTAAANAIENDGAAFYKTQDTTNGRTYWDGWNYFRLTGSGSGITTIADFFGSNDGIPLVASGVYEIEWDCWFSQATAGTATWTIVTATTALANLNAYYVGTPIGGIGTVGTPQTAGVVTTSSSSTALPVTGTEASGATHRFLVKAFLTAGAGASNTRLRLTMSAGTATPLINSYFRVRRLSGANVGTFAA